MNRKKQKNDNILNDMPVFDVIERIKDLSHYKSSAQQVFLQKINKKIILDFSKGKSKISVYDGFSKDLEGIL